MFAKEFKSEWQWQNYLNSLFSDPKKLMENIEDISKRSVFIFFFNIQLIYLIVNYIYQKEFVSNYVSYLQSTETFATYFPSFELYFENTIFYISFLIAVHFAGFLLFIVTTSIIVSKLQDTSFKNTLKKYLLFFSVVPILIFNQKLLMSSLLIMIVANSYLTKQTDWKPISKYFGSVFCLILFGIFFTLFQGKVL
jgi:hypothetical protein